VAHVADRVRAPDITTDSHGCGLDSIQNPPEFLRDEPNFHQSLYLLFLSFLRARETLGNTYMFQTWKETPQTVVRGLLDDGQALKQVPLLRTNISVGEMMVPIFMPTITLLDFVSFIQHNHKPMRSIWLEYQTGFKYVNYATFPDHLIRYLSRPVQSAIARQNSLPFKQRTGVYLPSFVARFNASVPHDEDTTIPAAAYPLTLAGLHTVVHAYNHPVKQLPPSLQTLVKTLETNASQCHNALNLRAVWSVVQGLREYTPMKVHVELDSQEAFYEVMVHPWSLPATWADLQAILLSNLLLTDTLLDPAHVYFQWVAPDTHLSDTRPMNEMEPCWPMTDTRTFSAWTCMLRMRLAVDAPSCGPLVHQAHKQLDKLNLPMQMMNSLRRLLTERNYSCDRLHAEYRFLLQNYRIHVSTQSSVDFDELMASDKKGLTTQLGYRKYNGGEAASPQAQADSARSGDTEDFDDDDHTLSGSATTDATLASVPAAPPRPSIGDQLRQRYPRKTLLKGIPPSRVSSTWLRTVFPNPWAPVTLPEWTPHFVVRTVAQWRPRGRPRARVGVQKRPVPPIRSRDRPSM